MEVGVPIGPGEAVQRLAGALERERASQVRTNDLSVEFRANFFRPVSNWNLLVPVDQGIFTVSGHAGALVIDYQLSFRRMLIVVTSITGGVAGLMLLDPATSLQGPVLVGIGWCWLFGVNYAIACMRFPRFIRRAITNGRPG